MNLNNELFSMRMGETKKIGGGSNLKVDYVVHMVQQGWVITTILRDTGQNDVGESLPPVVSTELIPFPENWYEDDGEEN